MRVESMAAQQAVLAQAARQGARPGMVRRALTSSRGGAPSSSSAGAGAGLPTVLADRIASLFADDPGLAEAVSAHLPAARRASARDLAAYTQSDAHRAPARIIETSG